MLALRTKMIGPECLEPTYSPPSQALISQAPWLCGNGPGKLMTKGWGHFSRPLGELLCTANTVPWGRSSVPLRSSELCQSPLTPHRLDVSSVPQGCGGTDGPGGTEEGKLAPPETLGGHRCQPACSVICPCWVPKGQDHLRGSNEWRKK